MKKPPYTRQRGDNHRWFFELGAERASAAGWFHESGRRIGKPKSSIPLGEGENKKQQAVIFKEAWGLYNKYLEDAGLVPDDPIDATLIDGYPPDSLGAFFFYWRLKGADWAIKSERTRDDYFRAWEHLGPALGAIPIHKISPDKFADFQQDIENKLSPWERFRVIKCARAMFRAAVKREIISASPATLLPNPMPAGRNSFFVAPEILKLAATAWMNKKPGMALAIWTAWDTALSPVDVRSLSLSMIKVDAVGAYIHKARTKTEAEVYAYISPDLWRAITDYISELERTGIVLGPHAPIFRKRRGTHYRDHKDLGQDFSRVRAKALPKDKRQFQDIRRSANLEMRLGEATKKERAEILANTLDTSGFLDATYTPPTVALARQMVEKRIKGRAALTAAN